MVVNARYDISPFGLERLQSSLEKPNLAMEGHDLHPKRLSGLKVEQRCLVSCQLSTDVSSIDTEQSGSGFFLIRCR